MPDASWASLGEVVASSGPPSPDQSMLVARWVVEALAEGHRVGAVHGGLTPWTVGLELDADGAPVRALILPPGQGGNDLGTAYEAPEVHVGGAPDPAADVYSCGAVLWHCLTGRHPEPGRPPQLDDMSEGQPMDAIRTMLSADPQTRPSTLAAARTLGGGTPDLAAPTPEPPRERSTGWVVALSTAILVLGLSALGWVLWQAVSADGPAPQAGTTASAIATGAADGGAAGPTPGAGDQVGSAATASSGEDSTTTTEDEAAHDAARQTEDEPTEDAPRQITLPAAAQLCEDGLDGPYPRVWAGNDVTSCPFSVNVRQAYVDQGLTGPDTEVVAESPVTGRTYTMTCDDTDPVRCRGGNSAIVYLGDD